MKQLREAAYLSQKDLGDKADISQKTISQLELGKQKPNFKTIRKLAEALGVEPCEIEF
ncbi:MAG: helix-turn-helix domain-containing protein [Dehalogenimonas sp.]